MVDPVGVITASLSLCNTVLQVLAQVKDNAAQRDRTSQRLKDLTDVITRWENRFQQDQLDQKLVDGVVRANRQNTEVAFRNPD